jgi:hypothetical protein
MKACRFSTGTASGVRLITPWSARIVSELSQVREQIRDDEAAYPGASMLIDFAAEIGPLRKFKDAEESFVFQGVGARKVAFFAADDEVGHEVLERPEVVVPVVRRASNLIEGRVLHFQDAGVLKLRVESRPPLEAR